jgi:hypothetical protein
VWVSLFCGVDLLAMRGEDGMRVHRGCGGQSKAVPCNLATCTHGRFGTGAWASEVSGAQ